MTVRIGQIGVAHIHAAGKVKVLRALDQAEFVGIYEPDPALREKHADNEAFRDIRWLEDVDALLGDPGVDAIVVETLPFDNLGWARRALAAGKHVHLDKAPSPSHAAFAELVTLAQRHGLAFQQGYHFPGNAGIAFLLEAVRSGLLGTIHGFRGRMSITPEMYESVRHEVSRSPGGMMFYLGCHLIDIAVALLGRPTAVHPVLQRAGGFDAPFIDNALALLEYPRAIATIESAAMDAGGFEKRRIEVYGSAGSVIIGPLEPPAVLLYLDHARDGYQAGWQRIEVGHRPRYQPELNELVDHIRTGAPLCRSPAHDLLSHEILLRACGAST